MTDEPELITAAQQRRLHTMFRQAGMSDRRDKIAFATRIVDRILSSSADLTKAEAGRVMDALAERLPEQEPVLESGP